MLRLLEVGVSLLGCVAVPKIEVPLWHPLVWSPPSWLGNSCACPREQIPWVQNPIALPLTTGDALSVLEVVGEEAPGGGV